MGINWSAIAGGVGEAINYHVDKRDEERKRKKAFEDAKFILTKEEKFTPFMSVFQFQPK